MKPTDHLEIKLFGYRLQLVRRMLCSPSPTDRIAGRLLLSVARTALLDHLQRSLDWGNLPVNRQQSPTML